MHIFPVRIHTNLKAEKLEEFEIKKKGLHIAAFKFRIEELRISLRDTAVKCARAREFPLQDRYRMLDEFVESIVKQVWCRRRPHTRASSILTANRSNGCLPSTRAPMPRTIQTTICIVAWSQSLCKL